MGKRRSSRRAQSFDRAWSRSAFLAGQPSLFPATRRSARGLRLESLEPRAMLAADVVINEIMYQADSADVGDEYIELFNRGTSAANLAGWHFAKGVDYTFTAGTLGAGQYLVVAADLARFNAKYPGVTNVVGGWTGRLSNSSEEIELADALSQTVDRVTYADEGDWATRVRGVLDRGHEGWSWHQAAEGGGSSLELINPALSNNSGQNWTSSTVAQGTPGATNSVHSTNIAPLITNLQQFPLIPKSSESVRITASILDELGIGTSASLHWRVDAAAPPPFSTTSMRDDGTGGDLVAGDGVWSALIPPQANNSVIEFYVSATDGSQARTFPSPALSNDLSTNLGQVANLLYQVDDILYTGAQPLYKLIMTENERAELQDIGTRPNDTFDDGAEDNSNAQMNLTFLSSDAGGTEIRYLAGIRNRGAGSRDVQPNNFRVNLPSDNPWKDVTSLNINGRWSTEEVVGSAIFRLANLPTQDALAVRVRVNNADLSVSGFDMFGTYADMEAENGDLVENHFPLDSAGNYYRGVRRPNGSAQATLAYRGDDPNSYRLDYTKATNAEDDDWTDLIELTKAFDPGITSDSAFPTVISQHIDVDQWLRYFAVSTLMGDRETTLATGFGDDYSMYRGVNDPRFKVIPHDLDTILGRGDTGPIINESIFAATSVPAVDRLLKHPAFAPLYFAQLKQLIETVYAPERIDALLKNLVGSYASTTSMDVMKNFVAQRNAAVLAQIPQTISITSALATQNGYLQTTNSSTSLSGLSDAIRTRTVLVNGVAANWTAWQATWTADNIALKPGINRIQVQALDADGVEFERKWIDVWYDDGSVTSVSGNLAGNVVWSPQNGPYHVIGNLTVVSGASLTIQPGTTVFFSPGVGLTINGRLHAVGTEYEHIRLTRLPSATSNWAGITISNTQQDNQLIYVDQEYGDTSGQSIYTSNTRILIDHMEWGNTTRQIVDFNNTSIIVRNSIFPSIQNQEPFHFSVFPANGYALIEGNTFGTSTGYSDIIDFTGGNRPGPIARFINNTFLGSSDDGIDLDGTDAYIEGNVFYNIHKNNTSNSESHAITTGAADNGTSNTSEVTAVNNFFYDVDHAFLVKGEGSLIALNNTIVKATVGAINFGEPERGQDYGKAAYIDGNIFHDVATMFRHHQDPGTNVEITVNRSIVPGPTVYPGIGNSNADPRLLKTTGVTDLKKDFQLRPGSPAIGAGPNGRDMGAAVPVGPSISGEPPALTRQTSATLTIGSQQFVSYKYKLNNGTFSAERPIGTPIQLSGLPDGTYTVHVVGRTDDGVWQPDSAATASKTWTVNTSLARLLINEVLADNSTAVNHGGTFPDLIELYNDSSSPRDLSGMSISDDPLVPRKFVFPAGTTIGAGEHLVLIADSTNATPGIHLGFSVNADGEGVYLYDTVANGGGLLDTVVFGQQLTDLSIGRLSDGTWGLTTPTLGAANVARLVGDPANLKINEWLTSGVAPFNDDFIELYNSDPAPVALGGLYLTDTPYGWPQREAIAPLSFIAGKGYAVFESDNGATADKIGFGLKREQGMIGLFGDDPSDPIDLVLYGTQRVGTSQGLSPDGSLLHSFFVQPNPGASNPAVVTPPTQTITYNLVQLDSQWSYNQSGDQGTAWREAGFDDSGWSAGQGLLYVEGSALPGPKNTPLTLGQRTYYFRKHFNLPVSPATLSSFTLDTVVDDGAVVYINGVEVFRIGMPNGTPSFDTFANRTVNNASLEGPFDLPISALVQGDNVIAVEVHQRNDDSSDVVWGGALTAKAEITVEPSMPPVVVTEINYNPLPGSGYDGDQFEFIELKNIGPSAVDLAGIQFTAGVSFTFPSLTLAPSATVVVVRNQDAFTSRYGAVTNIAGVFQDGLNNGGELIRLQAADGTFIQDFSYSDAWHPSTDGGGYSLTIVDPLGNPTTWGSAGSWRPSKFLFGAPGIDEPSLAPNAIVVNEVVSHSTNPATGDWIELHNTTGSPIDVSGWYLSDSSGATLKFRIPAGTVVPAGGFLVFNQTDHFGNAGNPGAEEPFALSDAGGELYVSSSASAGVLTGYRQGTGFGAAGSDTPVGRFTTSTGAVHFVALSVPTPAAANAAPQVGPVIMNEVMYHPTSGGDEYIELHNITPAAVQLFDPANPANRWRFTNGISFDFPADANLPAGGYALVVPIDPGAFRTKYSIPANVQIFGPYVGGLSNGGETIELSRPGVPDQGEVPYIVVDRLTYSDVAPWPTQPDGFGLSLVRRDVTAYGDDVANWSSSTTPGSPGVSNHPFSVSIGDVTVVEGNSGNANAVFTVTLSSASTQTITVGYATTDGSAVAGSDYSATSGVLTFAPGVTSQTISVPIHGDAAFEGDEQFLVDLLNATNASLAKAQAVGTIQNDDVGVLQVTNTADSGAGSLRQVILDANASPGTADTIVFAIPGAGPQAIQLTSALPALTDPVTLEVNAGQTVEVGTASAFTFAGYPQLTKTGEGTLTLAGPLSHAPGTALSINAGTINLNSDGGANLAVDVNSGARFNLGSTQHLAALNLAAGSETTIVAGANKIVVTDSLAMDGTARFNLTDNDVIVRATAANRDATLAALTAAVASGANGLAWDGDGIRSSAAAADVDFLTAVGIMVNDDGLGNPFHPSFVGESVDANAILLKYTYYGDADLSGVLDGTDYALIDNGFNAGLTGWFNGDFSYDLLVDGTDYALIDNAFNAQGSPLSTEPIAESLAFSSAMDQSPTLAPSSAERTGGSGSFSAGVGTAAERWSGEATALLEAVDLDSLADELTDLALEDWDDSLLDLLEDGLN